MIEAVAVIASAGTAMLLPVSGADWARFGVLAVGAAIYIELTRSIERQREFVAGAGPYVDTKSVWSFAAVLVCPPALATLMVVFTYALAWFRIWPRRRPSPLYRWIFSAATVLCGTQLAVAVLHLGMSHYPGIPSAQLPAGIIDVGIVALAGLARFAANYGLVIVAALMASPDLKLAKLMETFGEQSLEAAALGLGLVAATLVTLQPVVLVGVVIALVALHRCVLLAQFRQAARIDAKTGLYASGWWPQLAERALDRAKVRGTGLAVLMLDLDHFKDVNTNFGHLGGDEALRAVAREIAAETRDYDMTGRFGGEEFIVFLPEVDTSEVHRIAERIRRRIHGLAIPNGASDEPITGLTISIGAAIYPDEGIATLDDLIRAADKALLLAKDSGRNQTRIANTF
ncbi:GGDEF domain-containing protein [Fodinicola acaciae]|uniref:GGDEF domain-containing protein n=1 Tax=Fodinicola acaciae TaxID=2681555 RepID=UPI001C9E2379|nr:sensor domain-containing diguanylate cyclase [Fodinicola acaciae]